MKLSIQQKKAIEHETGPCLVLAVPGAGKTTILVQRMIRLLEQDGISPDRILALSFSKASATDIRRRFSQSAKGFKTPDIRTLHSLCYHLLKERADAKNEKFAILDPQKEKEIQKTLSGLCMQKTGEVLSPEAYRSIISAIGRAKSMLQSPDKTDDDFFEIAHFREYYRAYETALRNAGIMDFDDLLLNALHLLETNRPLRQTYQKKYTHILLDEAQDTSLVQWKILQQILAPPMNLFAVADDDQSIYRFRGALPEMLMRFQSEFPGAEILFLETNYRSSSEIVQSANILIQHNRVRYPKKIAAHRQRHAKVKVSILRDRGAQYASILRELGEKQGTKAVIYRNHQSAVLVMDTLDRHGILFSRSDRQIDFFHHPIFLDIVNLLELSCDPTFDHLYSKIYYKIKGYVSRSEINDTLSHAEKLNIFERIQRAPAIAQYKKDLIAEVDLAMRSIQHHFSGFALSSFLQETGFQDWVKRSRRDIERGMDTYRRILSTLSRIADRESSVDTFIERLRYLYRRSLSDIPSELHLMSMHGSKGLEFDHVFIVDLVASEIPGYAKTPEAMEEERRLLYVAMTRAKQSLHMMSYRSDLGEQVSVSPFLDDLKR